MADPLLTCVKCRNCDTIVCTERPAERRRPIRFEGNVRRNLLEAEWLVTWRLVMSHSSPFRSFKTSPEIIRLAVIMYVRFSLSLRNVEDPLHEGGIEASPETVRYWWNRFGPLFAKEMRRRQAQRLRAFPQWWWHLGEMFVQISSVTHYLWRAVDHEGEVLDAFVMAVRKPSKPTG